MSTDDGRRRQQVARLRSGTVVDHLNPGTALKALEVIGVPQDDEALLGINLTSHKMGRKDILKLENVEISAEQMEKLAVFGPQATVAIIRDYEVIEKRRVELPESIAGVLRCLNPNCITNHEPITTRFVVEKHSPTVVRCHYCERHIAESDFKLL